MSPRSAHAPVAEAVPPEAPRRTPRHARGEAHRLAVAAYQKRHREAGLCMLCARPAVSAHYCERHRRRINAQRRVRRTAARCGCCHRRGHNRRTCPERRADQ